MTLSEPLTLEERVQRDQVRAEIAAAAAVSQCAKATPALAPFDALQGVTAHDEARLGYEERREAALQAIAGHPFQAMAEVWTEIRSGLGSQQSDNVAQPDICFARPFRPTIGPSARSLRDPTPDSHSASVFRLGMPLVDFTADQTLVSCHDEYLPANLVAGNVVS